MSETPPLPPANGAASAEGTPERLSRLRQIQERLKAKNEQKGDGESPKATTKTGAAATSQENTQEQQANGSSTHATPQSSPLAAQRKISGVDGTREGDGGDRKVAGATPAGTPSKRERSEEGREESNVKEEKREGEDQQQYSTPKKDSGGTDGGSGVGSTPNGSAGRGGEAGKTARAGTGTSLASAIAAAASTAAPSSSSAAAAAAAAAATAASASPSQNKSSTDEENANSTTAAATPPRQAQQHASTNHSSSATTHRASSASSAAAAAARSSIKIKRELALRHPKVLPSCALCCYDLPRYRTTHLGTVLARFTSALCSYALPGVYPVSPYAMYTISPMVLRHLNLKGHIRTKLLGSGDGYAATI
eukprot:462804-Rhodomonas_salina.1